MPEAESHTSTVRGPESSHTTTGYDLADGQPAAVNVRQGEARFDAEEEREAALRAELQGVRSINQVLEGVLSSLDRAKENMAVVSRTVQSASALLDTWIQVLSQTEHNQRLMLNPSWQGASQDVVDIEKETKFRQQAAQRKEMEEQRRREAVRQKAEEEEEARHRAEAVAQRGARGVRARGRGLTRGIGMAGSGYHAGTGRGTRTVGRGDNTASARGSNVGRGYSSARVRHRPV